MNAQSIPNPHRYERWSGRLGGQWCTWLAIVRVGVRLAAKPASTRLILLMSSAFLVGNCCVFYVLSVVEILGASPQFRGLYGLLEVILGVDLSGLARISEHRETLWRMVFLVMLKAQLACVAVILAQAAPGLIANDLKSRALPIYFSKPLTPLTYLLGKWTIVAAFVGALTVAPNLLSLLIGTLLTGGLNSWGQTLHLAGDLVLLGAGIMAISGVVILALSAASADRRYVTVAWLAICLLPIVAQGVLDEAIPSTSTGGFLASISPYRDITVLANWLFDMHAAYRAMPLPSRAIEPALFRSLDPIYPALVLATVTLLAAVLAYRRVLRMSRAAAAL
jgi:ABC-type transport system involved in multi-copper enzyme maturation permease subunit